MNSLVLKHCYKDTDVQILIDKKDYELIKNYRLNVVKQKNNKLRVIVWHKKKMIGYLHRIVLNVTNPKIQVDHIDGNPLNNTRKNLRLVNNSKNAQNRNAQKNNTTGFKGVRFHKQANKYTAQIGFKGKQLYLGCFEDPKDAAKAYNKKAKELFGEYANVNKIS